MSATGAASSDSAETANTVSGRRRTPAAPSASQHSATSEQTLAVVMTAFRTLAGTPAARPKITAANGGYVKLKCAPG